MEVTVVLVLVSLISTILMQGVSYVLDLRIRFFNHHEKQVVKTLQGHWFRCVTSGFSSGYADPAYVVSNESERKYFFWGTDEEIQGVTLAALGADPGVPREVTLKLIKDKQSLVLRYSEFKYSAWEIARWKKGDGRFEFLDAQGNWQEHWPLMEKGGPTLPKAICLRVSNLQDETTWFSRIEGKSLARSSLRSIFGDF